MNSTDKVKVLSVGVRFRGAAATNSNFLVRCRLTAGGTVAEGPVLVPSSATWRTNDPAGSILGSKLNLYVRPDNVTASIKKSDLDILQIGYRITTANTSSIDVSAVWAVVEYAPAVPMDGRGFLKLR
jgi:hypothetical protein